MRPSTTTTVQSHRVHDVAFMIWNDGRAFHLTAQHLQGEYNPFLLLAEEVHA